MVDYRTQLCGTHDRRPTCGALSGDAAPSICQGSYVLSERWDRCAAKIRYEPFLRMRVSFSDEQRPLRFRCACVQGVVPADQYLSTMQGSSPR